jgi:hypothetical protein
LKLNHVGLEVNNILDHELVLSYSCHGMAMNTRRCIYWEFGSEIVVYGKIDTPSFAHSVPNTSVLEKKSKAATQTMVTVLEGR